MRRVPPFSRCDQADGAPPGVLEACSGHVGHGCRGRGDDGGGCGGLVVAGWVQLFSLMEGEGLPGLLAPPRARP
jgi:hypothetical protein